MNITYLIGQVVGIHNADYSDTSYLIIKYLIKGDKKYHFKQIKIYFKEYSMNRYIYLKEGNFVFIKGKLSNKTAKQELIIVADEIVPLETDIADNKAEDIKTFLDYGTKNNFCILKGTFLKNNFLLDEHIYYYGSIATTNKIPIKDKTYQYKKDCDYITAKFDKKGLFSIEVD